jgi:hypothetical protein
VSGPSLAAATVPRIWDGLTYRPLDDPRPARPLFDFAALAWPDEVAWAWGAFAPGPEGERMVAAVVAERAGSAAFLHGPVIAYRGDGTPAFARPAPETAAPGAEPLEVAAQLVAAALDHATATFARTIFARPQGLHRVWVRQGFIPVPESGLPAAFAGRPGAGLFAWRGGSALWSLRDAAQD